MEATLGGEGDEHDDRADRRHDPRRRELQRRLLGLRHRPLLSPHPFSSSSSQQRLKASCDLRALLCCYVRLYREARGAVARLRRLFSVGPAVQDANGIEELCVGMNKQVQILAR